jgi:alpha-tubulin suppressor-like RCC1 family protein
MSTRSFALLLLVLSACDSRPDCPTGELGCWCRADETCDGELVCTSGRCAPVFESDAGPTCGPCDSPPTRACVDGSTLRSYGAGECVDGACAYTFTDTHCPSGCAAGACVDGCAGVTCRTPPGGACYWSDGECVDGACRYRIAAGFACDDGDPCTTEDACDTAARCAGSRIACTTPPAAMCMGSRLRTYSSIGACSAGECDYHPVDTDCMFGCAEGRCLADPCASLSCTTPPAPQCMGVTLRTYSSAGTCAAGACSYPNTERTCDFGCSAGACNADPCAGLSCDSPPAAVCIGDVLRSYYPSCTGGMCRYPFTDRTCEHGCSSRMCNPPPCTAGSCTAPPASFCSGSSLHRYSLPGTCLSTGCSYASSVTTCDFGCTSGACNTGTGIIELAAGGLHTCALRDTGSVVCWGNNSDGQLGDGTTTLRRTPTVIGSFSGVIHLAAGQRYTCALRNDSTVACWGDNYTGQLGDGTTTDRLRPASVPDITDAIAIAAGGAHACALRSGGTVMCWGDNVYGQLGDGTNTDRLTPVAVASITDAIAITAGYYHTCALRSGGTIACWGDNSSGRLGDGTTTARNTPVAVASISDAVEVAASHASFTCARRSGGTVSCWGSNLFGYLGDGTTTSRSIPTAVSGITDAIDLSVGGSGGCVRRSAGALACWGYNGQGQVGDGTSTNRSSPAAVWGPITDALEIARGGSHTCMRRASSAVFCWGENEDAQLGDGTIMNRSTPTRVSGL